MLRGILTPLGHGLWTAILGGMLFATAARYGRPRLTAAVLGWYAVVALLHALWDASRGIAVWLTLHLTATPVQWLLIEFGRVPAWSQAQVHLFTVLSLALLALDALVGLLVLHGRWRWATKALDIPPRPDGAGRMVRIAHVPRRAPSTARRRSLRPTSAATSKDSPFRPSSSTATPTRSCRSRSAAGAPPKPSTAANWSRSPTRPTD